MEEIETGRNVSEVVSPVLGDITNIERAESITHGAKQIQHSVVVQTTNTERTRDQKAKRKISYKEVCSDVDSDYENDQQNKEETSKAKRKKQTVKPDERNATKHCCTSDTSTKADTSKVGGEMRPTGSGVPTTSTHDIEGQEGRPEAEKKKTMTGKEAMERIKKNRIIKRETECKE